MSAAGATLAARGLSVGYKVYGATAQVVADVDLAVVPSRILGLAGESGSGKTTLALALAGYRSPGSLILAGCAELDGVNLSAAPTKQLRRTWGTKVAYMPQDSATSLNPAMKVGTHLTEVLHKHRGLDRDLAKKKAIEWLERVEIPDARRALDRYPHQFSGGQQQRIALAIALAPEPAALILDEPTTGLDVITQSQVTRLLASLVRDLGTATLYVSHNLVLLATLCDDLAIMYGGEIVEVGPAREVFATPRHPYTAALIRAVPEINGGTPRGIEGIPPPEVVPDRCAFSDRCEFAAKACMSPIALTEVSEQRSVRCVRVAEGSLPAAGVVDRQRVASERRGRVDEAPILEVTGLRCEFRQGDHRLVAVDDLSVRLAAAEVLGIAGESGSGKSTFLRAIAGLVRPVAGTIAYRGVALAASASSRPAEARKAVQIVFQNPDATLNPRHTIRQSLARPLKLFRPEIARGDRDDVVAEMLRRVRLSPDLLGRRPSRLSGGQRQRVAIARALLAGPRLLLCDEITSALDVSVQASILELLVELRDQSDVSLLFVTHDLGVLSVIADDAIVMQRGVVCEEGESRQVLSEPRHPYTRALLDALPDPERAASAASVPA